MNSIESVFFWSAAVLCGAAFFSALLAVIFRRARAMDVADWLLLDTQEPDAPVIGATGKTHDWALSRAIVEAVEIPVVLAGGLGPDNVVEAIRAQVDKSMTQTRGRPPVLLTAPQIRPWVRRLIENAMRAVPVMAYSEIVRGFDVQSQGMVNLRDEP